MQSYCCKNRTIAMYIYRVEDYNGKGPYFNDTMIILSPHNNQPLPRQDNLTITEEDYCCFNSIEQLHAWFYQDYATLELHGFFIAIYSVPDLCVKIGSTQCLFNKYRATLVDTIGFIYIYARIGE
jgi:hypothetical protein